jgi:NAD-dependent dihydropyrimidine dehydrogenase PreA subunit
MAYVITEPCVNVKDLSCVEVCPVDCIHPRDSEPDFAGAKQLFINPDECIDCAACEPVCPVNAIFEADAVPAQWKNYIQLNKDFYKNRKA